MRTQKQLLDRLALYEGAQYIYGSQGYIAWQVSTGENIEILFIEASEKGQGYGKQLIADMCESCKPYHSVFVVRLARNEEAGKFYRALGFTETLIKGLYKGDDAVIGVIPFNQLKKNVKTN